MKKDILGGGVQPHFCPWKNVFSHCFPWGKMGKHTFFHGQKWGWTPPPPISYHNFHKLALYISFHTPQWFGEVARLHSYLALLQVLNLIFLKLSEYRPPPKIQ